MKTLAGGIGSLVCALWVLAAAVSVFYTPFDPVLMSLDERLQGPDREHWMGTDQYGRDVFSRVLSASAVSLLVSAATVFFALLLGAPVGALSAYLGGRFDQGTMMLTEALVAFPALLLVLLFLSITGPSMSAVIAALAVASLPTVIRVTRASVLSLREQQFVEAAWIAGSGRFFVLTRHLLPNCISPLSILVTSMFATVLLIESALSFLGLGVPAPQATWGALLADSRQYLAAAPWLSFYPGLVITLAVVGVNLLGDVLRDAADPKFVQAETRARN